MVENSFSFSNYKQTLFKLASILRRLRDFSEQLHLQSSIKSIDNVLERVETDSFSVAVVGEFKRGKSTLINALLGREILPSDILPTTATLNRVTYGLTPLVQIVFKDGRTEEIAINQLANYVTKLTPELETIAATVKEAVVYYPIPYCQNHIDIIDTPGLSDEENTTAVTLSVLPQVDAAILAIMAQSPFSETERAFLQEKLLTEDLGRVMFVVTGIDRCNRVEDAEKVVKSVEERIKKYIIEGAVKRFGQDSEQYRAYLRKIGEPKVFGVSAYQALKAKQTKDMELLNQSRFFELETALETFLTEERGAVFLQVAVNRAIASAKEILTTISSQSTVLKKKKQELRTNYEANITKLTQQQAAAKTQHKIDAIVERLKQEICPILPRLETELNQAVDGVIDSTKLMEYDLSKSLIQERMPKLDRKVVEVIESHTRKLAGKIQIKLRRGLAEAGDLQPTADEIRQVLNGIGIEFVNLTKSLNKKIAEGRVALIVASSFSVGNWIEQRWKQSDRVTTFKSNYKKAIFEEIAKQLKLYPISQQVDESILTFLDKLREKANFLEESELTGTQSCLAQLQVRLEREEILVDRELQELSQMQAKTEKILSEARALAEKLM